MGLSTLNTSPQAGTPPALPTDAPATQPVTQPSVQSTVEQVRELFGGLFDAETWGVLGLRILLVGLVIIAAFLILGIGRRLLANLQRARRLPDSVMFPIRRALRWTVVVLAFVLALQLAGFSVTTLWATLSAVLALIAVGFIAVWSVLSNIACSFMLIIFKPFRIGDQVELMDKAEGPNIGGRVTDVTLMYVVLREETDDGTPAFIQIPNNLFFQKTIRRRAGRRAVPIEQHVEKHGLTGREQRPPPGA